MKKPVRVKRNDSRLASRRWFGARCGGGVTLVALASVAMLGGCSHEQTADQTPVVTVQLGAAANQPIERKVVSDAVVYPLDQAAIIPQLNAPVKKFYVDRGSKVRVGQLLAELEDQEQVGAVAENQAGVQQADVAYQQQLQKAQQDLQLTKQSLDAAQRVYDGRKNLFEQGAAAAKDVDDARVALTQAQNAYDMAQHQYDLKAAEGELAAAKGKSTSAEAQLKYTRITSPIAGVVTDRPVYAGEMAPSGTPILTVMDLSQIIARAHISQSDAVHLKAGDAATITVPGEAQPIKGKVTVVSSALDAGGTTVEVWAQAPNPGGRLRAGSSARLTIVSETIPNAVVIPAESLLTTTDGITSVIVLDSNNAPHKTKVKTGIRDGGSVQVTSGLKGGERVVTVGAFALDQEDDDVLAKTKIQVQAPANIPDEDEDDDN